MPAQRIEPVWLDARVALAVHDRQLAEHRGGMGVRDMALLDSALARPINRWSHGEEDRCVIAAAYAYGIARRPPFVDGNKRTAWVLARLFLALNGQTLRFEPAGAINAMLRLAAGELSEEEMTGWLRKHVVK